MMNLTPMVQEFCGHLLPKREYLVIEGHVKCTDEQLSESFASYNLPFPIIVADLSAPGQDTSEVISGDYIPISNPIFEFNVC